MTRVRSRPHGGGCRARAAAKLADDILVIDVSEQLVITDCFVLASGANDRQVNAIVDEIEEKMRLARLQTGPPRGHREGRWVLLTTSTSSCMSSIRTSAEFYALDRLWRDRPVIPVDLGEANDVVPRGTVRIRRLVLLRHGQTEWNAGSRMQGQLDTDLTDLGRAQAVAAADVWPNASRC